MSIYCENSEKLYQSEGSFLILIGLILTFISQTFMDTLPIIFCYSVFFIGLYKLVNSVILRKNIDSPLVSIIASLMLISTSIYMLLNPITESIILLVATSIYLFMECIYSLSTAFEKYTIKPLFWVAIFIGIIQLALASIILYTSPFFDVWISGLALGLNFLVEGILNIAQYSYSKKLVYCTC